MILESLILGIVSGIVANAICFIASCIWHKIH